MASTFELSSQYYGTRHLRLACSQTTDIATNTSTIAWTLYSEGGSSDYYQTGPTTVKINGTTVYYKDVVYYYDGVFPAKKGSVSGTTTVQHDNDGTKSITVSITTAIYYSSTETKSGTWTLDSIPRYATLSTSLSSKTETAVTMSWTADATCDRLYYSTNNGSSFTQVTIAEASSGTYTITGLSANTTYNIKTKVRRKDSQLETTSSAVSVTTYAYPYATTMPNFTIGNQVQITIYNHLSRSCTVTVQTNAGTDNGNISTTGTTVKGWAGEYNISTFYASIPNVTSANYKVKVTYSGHSEIRTGGKYSINTTNCTPTIGSVTYKDTKTATVNVTGDDQKIVQNQSTVQYTASTVTAKNSASISSVKVTVNGSTYTMSLSSGNDVYGIATINSSSNVTATDTVTDSRGLTGTKSVTVSMYEWKLPTGIITMQRDNNFYTPTSVKCDASYSYLGGHNTISISYAGTKDGDSTATVTGTLSDNVAQTVNFDSPNRCASNITITDAFGTTIYNVRLERGQPIVFFDRHRTAVGFGAFPSTNRQVILSEDNALDDGWRLTAGGKYNTFKYMPYSWYTQGQASTSGWARVATLTCLATSGDSPITLRVIRRYDDTPVNLCLQFNSLADPDLLSFTYDIMPVTGSGGNGFDAYAVKTSAGVWDVYVRKLSANDYINVSADLGWYGQRKWDVTFVSDLQTSVPADAIKITNVWDDKTFNNTAKLNTIEYYPYTARMRGQASTNGYARIAQVVVTANRLGHPLTFTVDRLLDGRPVEFYFRLNNDAGTDPTLASFYHNGYEGTGTARKISAFCYKEDTSTWGIYVYKSNADDRFDVRTFVPPSSQEKLTINYTEVLLTTVPSGAVWATLAPLLTSTTETVTKTSGSSSVGTVRFAQDGRVCQLYVEITTTASVASGSNIFVGTANVATPYQYVTTCGYYLAQTLVAGLTNDGVLTLRNSSASAIPSGATFYLSFVYLTNS